MDHSSPSLLSQLPREGKRFRGVYRIDRGGAVLDKGVEEFNAAHHIDGVIRILSDEYQLIEVALPYLTHFNLEWTGNKVGARYVLPKILVQGYYRDVEDEVPPILSFDDVLVGICIAVREHVPYHALHQKDFRYSMKHIQNSEELQKAILTRYSVSMPNLHEREILDRGVAVTTLRLEGIFQT